MEGPDAQKSHYQQNVGSDKRGQGGKRKRGTTSCGGREGRLVSVRVLLQYISVGCG